MEKIHYIEKQAAFALKQTETGTQVEEVCRNMGVSKINFHNYEKLKQHTSNIPLGWTSERS
ncbi:MULTISPECIES: hypothetical protein [Edwardsiella]|uniref:hypothetical protein n=1 Tax=Edwardsiella TaxID=635 RepID=UPI0006724C20|nr:hypothetical protein F7P84_13730 [Edwardsiella anguillarum]